ncbi:sea9 [Bordetella bronchiseptica KM22]|nr:sea9 [Bordetella bronchiseptica KM22]
MKFASHYRIAGIGDIKTKKDGAIFLPFWVADL